MVVDDEYVCHGRVMIEEASAVPNTAKPLACPNEHYSTRLRAEHVLGTFSLEYRIGFFHPIRTVAVHREQDSTLLDHPALRVIGRAKHSVLQTLMRYSWYRP